MRHITLFIILMSCCAVAAAQPYCRINHYDEFSGMSHRLVKQAVQDKSGLMWFATWNGLNRFDGYSFVTVKPRVGDGSGVYSARINDIKLSSTGDLWCRIDNRCLLFDVRTYRFRDVLAEIEQRMGRHFEVVRIRPTTDSCLVMYCIGGISLIVADADPVSSATLCSGVPDAKFAPADNRSFDHIGGFGPEELVYARHDRYGTIWVVTRDGQIFHATTADGPLVRYTERLTADGPIYYSMTDSQGNVWLKSSSGVFCLTFGRYPYSAVNQAVRSQLRCLFRDSHGRVWMAGRDDGTLRVIASDGRELGYLTRSGRLSGGYASFGASVYCMAEDSRGRLWAGSKPDGLFVLDEQADGTFAVNRYRHDDDSRLSLASDNVYDLCFDGHGRLWVATMPGGVCCVEHPEDDVPVFVSPGGYPQAAMSVRRIAVTDGGVMLLATTGGLVTADVSGDGIGGMWWHLHVGERGRAESLSCVAVTDVLEDSRHRVFVATESGGVNMVVTPDLLSDTLSFRHFDTGNGLSSDVAQSLFEHDGLLWIVSDRSLMALDADSGTASTYDEHFWHRQLRFAETRPLTLGGGRMMFGLSDGGIEVTPGGMDTGCYVPPVVITAVSVQNRRDSLAMAFADTLMLQPDERSLTVRFAAPDYAAASEISYAFRMGDGGEWSVVGKTRSVTFPGMAPGTYRLMIRSTDSHGVWLDNVRELTIVVRPRFSETGWAKLLFAMAVLLVIGVTLKTVLYVRGVKRKQRETLEAYLRLLEERGKWREESGERRAERGEAVAALSEEDRLFMKRVMDFVEAHICDADAGIDDMAAAAAMSRSGLNRKMRQIMNVTPAEFLRETRLQRAQTLLATTSRPVNDIALECGFADQNYFAKCFKARRGVSPSAWRRGEGR